MHCHMEELVTRRFNETCFHWENEAVSPNSYGQGAVELNRKNWTEIKNEAMKRKFSPLMQKPPNEQD
jgi:hypothetical protein